MTRRLPLLVLLLGLLGLVAAPSAMADPVDDAPPATIRVCRSSGAVEVVPFKEYVKTVLPVEFYPSWPTETLRAGAAVIKSYAWYYVRHPISDRCDLGDTTRHQVYAPEKQRRTARSDQAVEDTWRLRLWDPSRGDIAFAQYCSNGCRVHARHAGAGRYMDQNEAFDRGQAGETHLGMLGHFYRNLPIEVTDWTAGLDIRGDVELLRLDDPPPVTLTLSGVSVDDSRVQVAAFAVCTIEGEWTSRLLAVVGPTAASDGATVARFDDLSGARECQDAEASVHFQLIVNGHVARVLGMTAWTQWGSAQPRDVVRLGTADEAVLASVQVSRETFPARESQAQGSSGLVEAILGGDEGDASDLATHAVIARSDKFPDALGATTLAGTTGPLLLHPSGDDAPLATVVAEELQRILEPGAKVHLVGGASALSPRLEDDLRDLGFTPVRTSGDDRVDTTLAIADRLVAREDEDISRVIIVRGYPNQTSGWADAVSVGPWAARSGTPILVTPPDRLADEVEAWIEDPANGIGEVILIGGPAAIAPGVEERLEGVTVTRVAGSRRDATALAVADELWGSRGTPEPAAAVVQNVFQAGGWSTAVAGSVPAARADAAAVSVWQQVPPTTTGLWLDARPGLPVIVIGGTAMVSAEVERSLAGA